MLPLNSNEASESRCPNGSGSRRDWAPRRNSSCSLLMRPANARAVTEPLRECAMSKVLELESAVRSLTAEEQNAFRDWFLEWEAQRWDKQIEEDAKAGRLDFLIEEARRELRD